MSSQSPGCLGALFRLFLPAQRITEPEPVVPEMYPYRVRDDFLSPAEALFYRVIKSMIGERLLICPKVSLAEIFFVSQGKNYQTYQNKIDRKRVDFLLCDPQTLKPLMAIELDDSSHNRPDRRERDAFVEKVFAAARLPLVRVPVQQSYNTRELASRFQSAMHAASATELLTATSESGVPLCPKCGIPMVRRTARRGNSSGHEFWGCVNYPRCREMRAIDNSPTPNSAKMTTGQLSTDL
jgi:ssDNA-binding Zn-finger/Zn-ribbon topoisomerase 1